MATAQQQFVSIPLDDRDITDLKARLAGYAGPGCVSLVGSVSGRMGSVTVHVPADPHSRSETLKIIREWRDAPRT